MSDFENFSLKLKIKYLKCDEKVASPKRVILDEPNNLILNNIENDIIDEVSIDQQEIDNELSINEMKNIVTSFLSSILDENFENNEFYSENISKIKELFHLEIIDLTSVVNFIYSMINGIFQNKKDITIETFFSISIKETFIQDKQKKKEKFITRHKKEISQIIRILIEFYKKYNEKSKILHEVFDPIFIQLTVKNPEIPKIKLENVILEEFLSVIKHDPFLNEINKIKSLNSEYFLDNKDDQMILDIYYSQNIDEILQYIFESEEIDDERKTSKQTNKRRKKRNKIKIQEDIQWDLEITEFEEKLKNNSQNSRNVNKIKPTYSEMFLRFLENKALFEI